MERNFKQFVWRNSRRAQLWVLTITVAVFALLYASLEIPKIVVNDAICQSASDSDHGSELK